MTLNNVVVALVSKNEGKRLRYAYKSLERNLRDVNGELVLADGSDEPESLEVVHALSALKGVHLLGHEHDQRSGKVPGLNAVADYFRESDAGFLIHFDADLDIDSDCLIELIAALRHGKDLVSPLSLSKPGSNLFARTLRVMIHPSEIDRSTRLAEYPFVGHGGGYTRAAVDKIFPIPLGGINEELWAIARCRSAGLPMGVVPTAVVRHTLPNSIDDYLSSTRRVAARTYQFMKSEAGRGMVGYPRLFPAPTLRSVGVSIGEDPIAAALLPFVLTVRLAAQQSSPKDIGDVWQPVPSTKR